MSRRFGWFGVVVQVARRPGLWRTAVRQARLLVPARWWATGRRLPMPSAEYLRFRVQTAEGGDGTAPLRPSDAVAYLAWCRSWRALEQSRSLVDGGRC